jgi:hypothetical protein
VLSENELGSTAGIKIHIAVGINIAVFRNVIP